MTFSRRAVLLTLTLTMTSGFAGAQNIDFESAYQIDPIPFAISGETSRDVRYIEISGNPGGKGRLILDANLCSLDEFGERDVCTEVYYRPFDVELPKIADHGPWTLYGIVPQGTHFPQYTMRIAINKEDPATANLLLNSGFAPDAILRVITLRRNQNPTAGSVNKFASTKHTVKMKNSAFVPKVLTIKAGDSVEWVNEDGARHNAQRDQTPGFKTEPANRTPDPNVPNDDLLRQGESSKPIVFNEKGRFEYFCRPHRGFMKAFIVVE